MGDFSTAEKRWRGNKARVVVSEGTQTAPPHQTNWESSICSKKIKKHHPTTRPQKKEKKRRKRGRIIPRLPLWECCEMGFLGGSRPGIPHWNLQAWKEGPVSRERRPIQRVCESDGPGRVVHRVPHRMRSPHHRSSWALQPNGTNIVPLKTPYCTHKHTSCVTRAHGTNLPIRGVMHPKNQRGHKVCEDCWGLVGDFCIFQTAEMALYCSLEPLSLCLILCPKISIYFLHICIPLELSVSS